MQNIRLFLKLQNNLFSITRFVFNKSELENELFVKLRSTGKLIRAKVELKDDTANVYLLEDEYGISPGQACVFYSKNNHGYKVLGGGWIKK